MRRRLRDLLPLSRDLWGVRQIIGDWRTPDRVLREGLDNFVWRTRAAGGTEDDAIDLLSCLPARGLREILLDCAAQRVPDGWWGEES